MNTNHLNSIMLAIVSTLTVIALPLVFFSESLQNAIEGLVGGESMAANRMMAAATITALFALDIFLPIPATAVCAIAGKLFGLLLGTLVCWIGLNLSAAIGYSLGCVLGWRAVHWFCDAQDVKLVKSQIDGWGVWPLIFCRAVPVFAEATVLMAGTYRFSAMRFFPAVALANLVVAATFVSIGVLFEEQDLFILGMVIACVIPAVAWWVVPFWLRNVRQEA